MGGLDVVLSWQLIYTLILTATGMFNLKSGGKFKTKYLGYICID